ncbi:cutinase family protein [Nocardia vaccinii]|uniref:cutinase family protein n=1 Tax=Nocardia vaccinii TaxID=1822 RepID=UPI00082DAA77|nr:cutinase family protein [Nocardia vaccinii]
MTHTPSPAHRPARARRAIRALSGIVAAVVAAVAVLGTGPAAADPAPNVTGCPRWTALLVPGTWETQPATPDQSTGMLGPIGQGLRQRYGSNISVHTLSYPASVTPYNTSESEGVQALSTTLAGLCTSTRVVLAGYSQGADVAGDVATKIGHDQGPLPASRVVAVALISDPRRNTSTPQLGHTEPGEGIAGPRGEDFGALAGRVRTVCASGDLYCGTSPQAAPALAAVGRAFTGTTTTASSDTTVPSPALTPSPTTDPTASSQASPDSTPVTPGSLGGLDPSQVVEQVVTVLGGLAGFAADVPAIVNDLAQLPGLIGSGNLAGLHQVSGDLNNQFAPLVQIAAQIDLHLVAQALALAAPLDTSGWIGIASQIVGIVANLDIGRFATDIGQAQEIAWGAVQKLTTGDPVGAALALSGVIPVVADLAATAASALTGDTGARLAGLARTFTATTTPGTSTALGDLARQGSDAARFATSGVHQNGYTTAVQQILNWLDSRIDQTR